MLRELPGVVNVVDIDFFNMQGGGYSETLHAQSTGAIENIIGTGGYRVAMNPQDNAIFWKLFSYVLSSGIQIKIFRVRVCLLNFFFCQDLLDSNMISLKKLKSTIS